MDLMFSQQLAHDLRDHPMFDVVVVVGQRDRLQPGGFFAVSRAGMVQRGSNP